MALPDGLIVIKEAIPEVAGGEIVRFTQMSSRIFSMEPETKRTSGSPSAQPRVGTVGDFDAYVIA